MNSDIIKANIEFHAGEAHRLLQHPLVSEFNHHAQRVTALQAELKALTDKEARPEAKSKGRRKKTDTVAN